MDHIGQNIKILRKQKGWKQREVAEQLEISVPAFSKMETGITDMNFSRLKQIAALFGVRPTELLANGMEDISTSNMDAEVLRTRLALKEEEIVSLQAKIIQLYEMVHAQKEDK